MADNEPTSLTPTSIGIRIKLSAMMFLQFMLFAVFWVQLPIYLDAIGVAGMQKWLIQASMGIGCLMSPIVGMIADRHFASQKVLFALNALSAVLLLVASYTSAPLLLFAVVLIFMLIYMPTWGLTNAIAMTHAPAEKLPQIRVFGSIGWFASRFFTDGAIHIFKMDGIDGTVAPNIPLVIGGIVCAIGALVALTIPNTPPPAKGKPASIVDALGLRAAGLMKDMNFAFFIFASILVMFPFALYWSHFGSFLSAKGFGDVATSLANWGQFAEMFLMLLVPIAILKFGIKWTMALGMLALTVRFGAFSIAEAYGGDIWIYIGILVHGLIFGFFFVGGQIYVDKKAPEEIRGQAQGFIFLTTFGVGLVAGTLAYGKIIEVYGWAGAMQSAGVISAIGLVLFALIFKNEFGGKEEAQAVPAGDAPAAAIEGAPAPTEEAPAPPAEAPAADDAEEAAAADEAQGDDDE
ncbi:MAG: MFS transporter [Phycisphaerae bacterium]|jgi:nucleoside transporter|nr:MFS transporter [Phycisphaerae bacterium]